jgi:phosphoglucosamine mutase
MARLFGTDGVRGIANKELTAQTAFSIGRAAASVIAKNAQHKPSVYIGKDTRISGDMLEMALAAGITSAGAGVIFAGVVPTPAIAMLARDGADAGFVISASHNPYEYNGIKIFGGDGCKLSDEQEDEIEALIRTELPAGESIGRVRHDSAAAEKYINSLLSCESPRLSGLRIAIDCSNGAASATAGKLFSSLGAKELRIIHNSPDGVNINDRCGSTYLDSLIKTVTDGGYDAGIAFDGDADRCLCVDGGGKVIDGDSVLAVCAIREKRLGFLPGTRFVCTVMSNMGLHVWARKKGLETIRAQVGDRYVLKEMLDRGALLGGEQSGHVIFLRHSAAGDGQLTALKLLSEMAETGKSLAALTQDIPNYPQVLLNVTVKPEAKEALASSPGLLRAVEAAEKELGENGRVLVRPSGTEPLVRVMVEGKNREDVRRLADNIAACIE